MPEKTQKCFGRVKQKLSDSDDHGEKGKKSKARKKKCLFLGKVRELSYAALFGIFQTCLSCAATVDVADQ